MEAYRELTDTVLLLDTYGEESEMLRQSFRSAGFEGPVIVIEDDGIGMNREKILEAWMHVGKRC